MDEKNDFIDNDNLGLGAYLKKEREAKGMSLKEAAKALYYKSSLLEQIEADDYADLCSETFARGYLKSYAKLLNVPVDEVLTTFEQSNFSKNIKSHKPEFINEQKYGVKNRSFRWISYLIILVLIGLVLLWWQSHSLDIKINTRSPSGNYTKLLKQKPEPQDIPIRPLIDNLQSVMRQHAVPTTVPTMSENTTS